MAGPVGAELRNLARSLAFFTRIPVARRFLAGDSEDFTIARSAHWFPIVGLIVAAPSALAYWLVAHAGFPLLGACLAIAISVLITGALHEDGLADCADSLSVSNDPERAMEIMRDSRLGVFGAVALFLSLGLRFSSLASLSPIAGAAALLIAHAGGRGGIALAPGLSRYARLHGAGSVVAAGISKSGLWIALSVTLALAGAIGHWQGVVSAVLGLAFAWLVLKWFERKLGGYTGDVLGCMEQVGEIAILIGLVFLWAQP